MRGMLMMLALLLGTLPAGAQVSDNIIAAMVGDWQVLPVDGRRGCAVKLTAEESIGGLAAVPADDCAQYVPEIADASAWHLMDGIHFTDPVRQPLLVFTEDETTLLSSPSVADPVFYLIPERPGLIHVPKASAMPGTWRLADGKGKPLCSLRLEAPAGDNAILRVAPECKQTALPKGLKSWRLEVLDLYLEGDDDAMLAFRPEADDRFSSDDGRLTLQRDKEK